MTKKLLILTIALMAFISCNYLVEDCEGFPDSDLIYIPYQIGNVIQYQNGTDTISMTVDSFFKTEPYEIRGSFPQTGFDDCSYTGFYETSQELEYGYQIRDEYSGGFDITINTKNTFEIFNTFNCSIEHLDFIEIGDNRFEDVYLFEKDTAENSPIISKVIKASNRGVIQFYDFENKQLWNLIIK